MKKLTISDDQNTVQFKCGCVLHFVESKDGCEECFFGGFLTCVIDCEENDIPCSTSERNDGKYGIFLRESE